RHGADNPGVHHQPCQFGGQLITLENGLLSRHPVVIAVVVAPEVLVGVDDREPVRWRRAGRSPGRSAGPTRRALTQAHLLPTPAGSVPPYAHCLFITGSRMLCTAATSSRSTGSAAQARFLANTVGVAQLKIVTLKRGSWLEKPNASLGREVPCSAAKVAACENNARASAVAGCHGGGSAPVSRPLAN